MRPNREFHPKKPIENKKTAAIFNIGTLIDDQIICSTRTMDDKVKKPSLQALRGSSPLAGSNAVYLEHIYETYLQNPDSVAPEWRSYFDTLPQVNGTIKDIPHSEIRNTFRQIARLHKPSKPAADIAQQSTVHEGKQVR
ncbi:MAG: hypothetical protein KAT04_08030, partial [Methylococcales bacterium]|nr:hypothetical protein [Methylococcales bacterium]